MGKLSPFASAPLLVLLSFSLPALADPVRFKVVADLGVGISASHLNDRDEVLSVYQASPAVWSAASGFTKLLLPGPAVNYQSVYAADLNNAGQVIGGAVENICPPFCNRDVHSYLWVWKNPQTIPVDVNTPVLPNVLGQHFRALNDRGTTTGNDTHGPDSLPWVRPDDPQHPRDFPNAGGRATVASDINNADTVVGYSNDSGEQPRAFLSSTSSSQFLGALPGDVNSRAVAINNSGVVAGDSSPGAGPPQFGQSYRAVIWTPQSGIADLGTPAGMISSVTAISDRDWIIGAWGQGSTTKPFLWRPGVGMADLSFLVDLSGTDFKSLSTAIDINARGDILASVLDASGRSHIVIFALVPEPGGWLFAVWGLLLLVIQRASRFLRERTSASRIANHPRRERRVRVAFCSRVALAMGLATAGFSLHAEPVRYAVKIDLGTGFHAIKLNNLDQILGQQQGVSGVWSPGTGFAALPAPTDTVAGFSAVNFNDKGQAIGFAWDAQDGSARALLWSSLKAAPVPIAQGKPLAINANGQIAIWPSHSLDPGLVWSNGKTVALPNYHNVGFDPLHPTDINDLGAVAAISGSGVALRVTQTTTEEIGPVVTPSAFPPDQGLYINNAGAVAGNSDHSANGVLGSRAFLWTPQSGTIDLGTPGNQSSFVMGLDEHNRVLGYLDRNGGTPFLWQPGVGMTELTSLIDLSGQYVRMQSVADINSRGDILGSILDIDGVPHIVVLMAVPEPTAWLIGALGMVLGVLVSARSTGSRPDPQLTSPQMSPL